MPVLPKEVPWRSSSATAMKQDFFRFPHTQHIVWLGKGKPRNDKVMSVSEVAELLSGPVIVEEKVDGANLGFSVSADGKLLAQNRGAYLSKPYVGQFQRLSAWMAIHGDYLARALDEQLIAFGEWCAARHSLDYPSLPDWWLLFDVYDRRENRFWSTYRRNTFAEELGLSVVRPVAAGRQSVTSLLDGLQSWESHYRSGALEGVVVRREDELWLQARGKLVRADFTQALDSHWRARKIEWNRVTERQ